MPKTYKKTILQYSLNEFKWEVLISGMPNHQLHLHWLFIDSLTDAELQKLSLLSCHNSLCPYSWQNTLSMSKHFFVLATNQKFDLLCLCLYKRALFQLFWGAPWPCVDGHMNIVEYFGDKASLVAVKLLILGLDIICPPFCAPQFCVWSLNCGHF